MALRKVGMATKSSEILNGLLDAGFSRTTLVSVAGINLQELSGVRMERVIFSPDVQEKLSGLLSWAKCMKSSSAFDINPAAYYELQMVLLEVDGKEMYTSLHELYEADIITPMEMKSLTIIFPALYDYNAFIHEFPGRADIAMDDDPDEAALVVHYGVPEVGYDDQEKRERTRKAVVELLEKHGAYRDSRRLAS